MADKPIIMQDPLTGDRLFPATTSDAIYGPDGKPFDFEALKPAITSTRKLAPNQIIFTGDVVDVLDDGTVGKTATYPNDCSYTNYGLTTDVFSDIRPKCCALGGDRAIAVSTSRASGVPKVVATIYNISGKNPAITKDHSGNMMANVTLVTESSAATYIYGMSVVLLSDNRFLLVYDTRSDQLKASVIRVSETSTSVPTPTVIGDVSSSGIAQGPNCIDTILIDTDTVIVFYCKYGPMAKIITVSNEVTVSSGDAYPLENIGSPYHLTATRLPDENGSVRICVVYTMNSLGAFAVIVTVTDGVISWGTPVAISTSTSDAHDSVCSIDNNVYVIMHTSKTIKKIIADGNNITIPGISAEIPIVSTYGTTKMIPKNGRIITTYTVPGQTKYVYTNTMVIDDIGDNFIIGSPYQLALTNATISWNHTTDMVALDKNKFFVYVAYGFSSSNKMGAAYTFETLQNQCSGRIIDTSRHAIALQYGNAYAGDSVDVVFDGMVNLPGISRGYEIKSNLGVRGYCPTDGILSVIPAWNSDEDDRITHIQWSGSSTSVSIALNKPSVKYALVSVVTYSGSISDIGSAIILANTPAIIGGCARVRSSLVAIATVNLSVTATNQTLSLGATDSKCPITEVSALVF